MGRLSPADFLAVYGFRRPDAALAPYPVCGLDYPFTLLTECPELRCCPSSLYTFPAGVSPGLARDCHFEVSPTLSSSASPVSRRALKYFLRPLRMPFRHARAQLSDCLSMIRHDPHFKSRASASFATRAGQPHCIATALLAGVELGKLLAEMGHLGCIVVNDLRTKGMVRRVILM